MESLKARLRDYYEELRSDYGDEEVDNTLEVLEEQDENLSKLGKWDKTLLLRLIDESELYREVDNLSGN